MDITRKEKRTKKKALGTYVIEGFGPRNFETGIRKTAMTLE